MITRGYYIGEVVDELSAIAAQISMRNKLGMTDLSVLVENFFRDLLNSVRGISLDNLNSERFNVPGLDLGDEIAGLALQVTSTATAQKVNATLKKITDDQLNKYSRFVVLIVGSKQHSYAIDAKAAKRVGFSMETDIWDLDAIARDVVALDIARLQNVHRVVRAEVARVKIELEVPDGEGKYPTSGYELWEEPAKPKVGDGSAFRNFVAVAADISEEVVDKKLPKAIETLAKSLSNLPRITREFLVMLLSRVEPRTSSRFHEPWMTLLYDKVKREYRGADIEGEIGILQDADFVDIRTDNPYDDGPPELGVRIPSNCPDLSHSFLEFVVARKLSLRKVVGEVDLSAF